MTTHTKGGFTLPGEAGCEDLTLQLAQRWGADVIRDSDGTQLSDEILNAGYDIYSTICIIRGHNQWAKAHPNCLQQTFLSTSPRPAEGGALQISLLAEFFHQQFKVNDGPRALPYWQVWDRTSGTLLSPDAWHWDKDSGCVIIDAPIPWHLYTVSFLAYRLWEEISMYNHVTNHWDSEHLMPVDPRTPEARAYLTQWLRQWCEDHPHTNVVRFTSMFYNFVWIWGADTRNQSLFTDWGSYDFTVSEQALEDFKAETGYALTAEDFINKGNLQVTHMPPSPHKRDYMAFTQRFVAGFGKELVDLVHQYGKKAYVFYDDSWVGVEPYGPYFSQFGFDGIIKCVFSGYEARMCAGVKADVHELRLHPYLFPVGLGGAPTFAPGGDPTRDARDYWLHVRRALLRDKIDRIGLGGYLHLLKDYPDFVEYIANVANEFRTLRDLHDTGRVYTMPLTVAVLHSWGSLRPWTLSGHFHETYMFDLIHINEALAGLPVNTRFLSFEDVLDGKLEGVDVIINAGPAGTAWSGGDAWHNADLVARLHQWVAEGGVFLGVNEPSAAAGYGDYFRMARVLGVDEDTGARVCHGRWPVNVHSVAGLLPEGCTVKSRSGLYLTDGDTHVLAASDGQPAIAAHTFGKGCGVYMGGFAYSPVNARMLLNLLLWATGRPLTCDYLPDMPQVECAAWPEEGKLVLINNGETDVETTIPTPKGDVTARLSPYQTLILDQ